MCDTLLTPMDKSKVTVAIVIPVYNRAEIVRDTLNSLAAQTLRPLHIVLVDNASTDNTLETLENWKASEQSDDFIVDIIRCDTPGAAAARNAGLGAVNEPWTMFFDSDDLMPSGHAANVAAHVDDADIIGWDVEMVSETKRRQLKFIRRGKENFDNLFHGSMATQRWAARTSLLQQVGGWNDEIRYWDDIELGARILALNPRTLHLGQSGVKVIERPDSMTRKAAGKPEMALAPLRLINHTLTVKYGTSRAKVWCDVKLAVECGITDRAGSRIGKNLLFSTKNLSRRAKWAYFHTRLGLPGAAELLKTLHLL